MSSGKLYVSKEGSLNAEIDGKKVTLHDAENAQDVDVAEVMTDCFMSGLEEMRKASLGRLDALSLDVLLELGNQYLSGKINYQEVNDSVRLTIEEAL